MRRDLGVVLLLGLLGSQVATAQSGAFRFGVVGSRAERETPATGTQALSGVGWTLDGALRVGIVTLGLRYLQSPLSSDSTPDTIDLVEGETLLWVAPVRWAEVGFGPHLRAYAQGGGTERWVMWEIRARGAAALVGSRIGAYAELWGALGGSVNNGAPFGGGRGMEGGLRFNFSRLPLGLDRLPFGVGRLPFSARLRYRVERVTLEGGARTETVEQLGVAFGVGRR